MASFRRKQRISIAKLPSIEPSTAVEPCNAKMLPGCPRSQTFEGSEGLLDHDPEMPLEGDFAIPSDGNDSRTGFSLDPLSLAKKIKQSCSGGSSDMEFAFGPIETLAHKGPLTVVAQTIQIDPE